MKIHHALLTALLLILGQQATTAQNIQIGDSVAIGDGFAYVWIETDEEGIPVNTGMTLDASVMSNLPSAVSQNWVQFPDAGDHSLWEVMLFDWNPGGHPPAVYSIPHFDFHFAIVPRLVMDPIQNGPHNVPVAPDLIPPGYEPDVSPPFAIANMGVHYVDRMDAPEWNGELFSHTMIWGFYQGELLFLEPMITRDFLLAKTDVSIPIKQPDRYATPGYYPTSYTITFDEDAQQHRVTLTDFEAKTTTTTESENVPAALTLSQNFPNPAAKSTRIQYETNELRDLKLEIFDMLGRRIAVPVDQPTAPGLHEVRVDVSELPSGLYVYRLSSGEWTETRSMSIVGAHP